MRPLVSFGLFLVLIGPPASLVAELSALPRAPRVSYDAPTRERPLSSDDDSRRPDGRPLCRPGDRGRLLHSVRVASYPTATDARAYYDAWIQFYQGLYVFPPYPPVRIDY